MFALRGVDCDVALKVAKKFDRREVEVSPWVCGLSHGGGRNLFSCGYPARPGRHPRLRPRAGRQGRRQVARPGAALGRRVGRSARLGRRLGAERRGDLGERRALGVGDALAADPEHAARLVGLGGALRDAERELPVGLEPRPASPRRSSSATASPIFCSPLVWRSSLLENCFGSTCGAFEAIAPISSCSCSLFASA